MAVICLANEPTDFDRFTQLELLVLCKNSTGVGYGGYSKDVLCQVLYELTTRMQVMAYNMDELLAQANAIPDGDNDVYQFVPGARKPKKPIDLYEPVPLHVDRNIPAEQKALATPLVRTVAVAAPFVSATTPNPVERAPKPASTPQRAAAAPSSPGAGSVTERIYAKADELWAAAGKPSDPAAIKQLRKDKIIPALVADGVNSNSAGKGSLMWQKARFNI